MREILFRGFTPDEKGRDKAFVNGEWIKGQWLQGSYMTLNETTYCFKEDYEANPNNTKHYIVFDQMTDCGLPNRHLQGDVIPETIGQYTGLTDKNGKKIFEGDIVASAGCLWVIAYENGSFVAQDERGRIYYTLYEHRKYICEYEVIGNIHDNPELLEGGASDER